MQYGFYKESLISITKKGMKGAEEIAEMMSAYRQQPPSVINGSPVVKIFDYQLQHVTTLATGEKTPIDLPKSNVLQFLLADGSRISARPSGTEPKIKFYFSVHEPLESVADVERVEQLLDNKVSNIIHDMKLG